MCDLAKDTIIPQTTVSAPLPVKYKTEVGIELRRDVKIGQLRWKSPRSTSLPCEISGNFRGARLNPKIMLKVFQTKNLTRE